MAHQIEPQQDNDLIAVGRVISEESYSREKKEILLDNIVIDVLTNDDEKIVIAEVKKSSRFIESTKMQLAFYLWQLKQRGIDKITGELRFPKERKKIKISLTPSLETELNKTCNEIEAIVNFDKPPKPIKIHYCKTCGYYELCWI